jgi:hypothetical protein
MASSVAGSNSVVFFPVGTPDGPHLCSLSLLLVARLKAAVTMVETTC